MMHNLECQDHDWDMQMQETEEVWSSLLTKGVDFARKYRLDFQFIPQGESADHEAFATAFAAEGYDVALYEEDTTIEASVGKVDLSLNAIWHHEKRTTKIALRFGFEPDGWGFFH